MDIDLNICPRCKKSFASKESLISHLNKKYPCKDINGYNCPYCNKNFDRNYNFIRHLKDVCLKKNLTETLTNNIKENISEILSDKLKNNSSNDIINSFKQISDNLTNKNADMNEIINKMIDINDSKMISFLNIIKILAENSKNQNLTQNIVNATNNITPVLK